jgi:hypothetical protein
MTSATVASQLEIRSLENNKLKKKERRTTLSTLNHLDGVTSTVENVNYIYNFKLPIENGIIEQVVEN